MPLYIETCALCGLCKPIFSGTWQVDYNLILRYAAGNKQYKARKGVSPDTPSHIIQKHYEFYLANKIKSYRYVNYSQLDIFCWLFLLRHFESALFAFAIAFALSANVVAEHGSEYEVLFRAKLV